MYFLFYDKLYFQYYYIFELRINEIIILEVLKIQMQKFILRPLCKCLYLLFNELAYGQTNEG